MIKLFASTQFLAFLVTGGIAAIVNFFSRIVLNAWMTFSSAVIVSYIIGMLTAFLLAKIFVFKDSTQNLYKSFVLFSAINVAAIIQTWLVSLGMAYYLLPAMSVDRFALEIAHIVGISVPAFTSYLGHKYWSFRA